MFSLANVRYRFVSRLPSSVRSAIWGCLPPVVLACTVYTVFFFFGKYLAWSNAAEQAQDEMFAFQSNRQKIDLNNERRVLFIDFDEHTLSEQGDPPLIPAPLITATLEQLAKSASRAWAIFIDIDLTYLPPGGQLDQLQHALLTLQAHGVPVFLERELLSGFPGHSPHFRMTPLSTLVTGSPTIAWFSLVTVPSAQAIERHLLYKVSGTVGLDGATTEQVPSAALAALLLQKTNSESAAKDLLTSAFEHPRLACPETVPEETSCFATNPPLVLGEKQQTIRYTLRWRNSGSLLQSIPVERFLKGRESDLSIAPSAFDKNIVILGSSAPDRGDLHQTALGEMPGSLVLANAIRAWLLYGPEKPPSYWHELLVVVLVASLLAFLNYVVLPITPERQQGIIRTLFSQAVPVLLLLIFCAVGFSTGVLWLIPLQSANTILIRSPTEKGSILAWLAPRWRKRRAKTAQRHLP